jgi:tRNA threonylcarbamoyl adenosine modification protein YeaZ
MSMVDSVSDTSPIAITLPGPGWGRVNAICIDTATDMASIALIESGEVAAEQQWRTGMSHTRQLAARLQQLALESAFRLGAANFLCVCVGPGSFNGIRTGIATAIGLAQGLGVPIYGTATLDLMAYPHADRSPTQRAVLSAGKGEFYSALFGSRGGRWRRMSPYVVASLETLAQESPAKCLWCGVHSEEDLDALATLLGGARRVITPPHNVRRAAYLAPLALAAAAAGADGMFDSLRPLYLRRPAITQPRGMAVAGRG